jgi:hypothetical protein
MPLFFEIDKDLNFQVEILIDSEILRHGLLRLFRNTIGYASKISAQYDAFIARDGKILGQERIQLLEKRTNKLTTFGKIVQEDLYGIKNFSSGYETLILEKIKKLLIVYKNSIQGETIRENRFGEIYSMIDDIFSNIIAVRYNLENCLIDR